MTAPLLFPESTLAYFRIDDTVELREKMAQTSLGKIVEDRQVKPVLSEFYKTFRETIPDLQPILGITFEELISIPNGELAVAIVPTKPSKGQKAIAQSNGEEQTDDEAASRDPMPVHFALMLEAGDQLPSIELMLDRGENQLQNQGMSKKEKKIGAVNVVQWSRDEGREPIAGYFIDSGVLVFSNSNYAERLAKIWTGNAADHVPLANNRRFTSILTRCVGIDGERPQFSYFVDPIEFAKTIASTNTAATLAVGLLPSLGIDGLQGIGGSLIIAPKDFDSIGHMHVLLATPRRGVMKVLRPKQGDTTPQNWIGEDVATYMTMNWEIGATMAGVKEIFEKFNGEGSYQKSFIDVASKELNIDFQKEFLDQIDSRLTLAQIFLKPSRLNGGSNIYAIRVKNPSLMKDSIIPKIFEKLSQRDTQLKRESYGEYVLFWRESERPKTLSNIETGAQERTSNGEFIRMPEPTMTVIGNELLMSDSKQAIEMAIEVAKSNEGLLRDALEFKLVQERIKKQLKNTESSIIAYTRPEEAMRSIYDLAADRSNIEMLRKNSENNPALKAIVSALDKNQLPPFDVIAKYLSPSGAYVTEEENGLHYTSFGLRRK